MKRFLPFFLLAVAFVLPAVVCGQVLYLATGSSAQPGQLFTIIPATAAATYVGDITAGGIQMGITGMAFQPGTGVLFAVTSNGSPGYAAHLVTINPASGAATVIGSLGGAVSDITFNAAGSVLFGWSPINLSTVTIDLTTGMAATLGSSLGSQTHGGAIVINPGTGIGYVSQSGGTGTLDTFNPSVGDLVTGVTLNGIPPGYALGAMAITMRAGFTPCA